MYRIFFALPCALVVSSACVAGDYESAFPYDVETVAENAAVRCGPGDAFYATERINRGRSLSVYRQAAGGWLAIRPTKASYSLVAARYVRPTAEKDVVEVVDDHAVSWVGGHGVESRELNWQVRLKPGEKVVVLGEETRRTFPGGPREPHYRISPPAGEFRWIHEQDVRHASQVETDDLAPQGTIRLTDFRVVVEEPDAPPRRDGFVARVPSTSKPPTELEENRRDQSRVARRAPRERVVPQPARRPLNAAEFEKQLRKLDVELSLTVAQPIEDWQLDQLGKDVETLVARGATTVDRGRAQLLAANVDEFRQLYSRSKSQEATADVSPTADTQPDVSPTPLAAPTGVDPRFDGAGWLYPVHSRNQASPPYALLDADGAILQFVSPAPGLNLHRYLRTEIGIFGQQTAGSSLEKPHVTAHRVVGLKRHRR